MPISIASETPRACPKRRPLRPLPASLTRLALAATVFLALTGIHALWPTPQAYAASSHGTAEEARAMVNRAADLLITAGPETAYAAFNNPQGAFIDRDLYVFCLTLDGIIVAHGSNKGLIGKTGTIIKDPNGKEFPKEMISVARDKGEGWVDYAWINPTTRKIEQKTTFVRRVGDTVIGVGVHKEQ